MTLNDPKYRCPENRVFVWICRVFCIMALLIMSYLGTIPTEPSDAPKYFDKVLHFGAFAVLTGLAILALPRTKLWPLIIGVTFYGVALEIVQGMMSLGRTASPFDVLANIAGTIFIILLWTKWVHYRRASRSHALPSPLQAE